MAFKALCMKSYNALIITKSISWYDLCHVICHLSTEKYMYIYIENSKIVVKMLKHLHLSVSPVC